MAKTFPTEVSLYQAKRALQENAKLLGPETHKVLWNQNEALIGICDALDRLARDVEILHSKIQPVLKQIADDQDDVRQITRRK